MNNRIIWDINEWCAGSWEYSEEAIEWMRSRPDSVKQLMLQFPPSCVVKANRQLVCPAPGCFGVVTAFTEDGQIAVRNAGEGATMQALCKPEWLEVVNYWKGWTPEKMRIILRVLH